jgi:hypothetical protein
MEFLYDKQMVKRGAWLLATCGAVLLHTLFFLPPDYFPDDFPVGAASL